MKDHLGKVCVIEDDAFIALDTSLILEDLGFEVAGPCYTLKSALERCKCCAFDCALLDVNLGQGETSEAIVDILRDRRIPFAFLTAYNPDAVPFRRADDPCLTKPITASALKSVVERLLR